MKKEDYPKEIQEKYGKEIDEMYDPNFFYEYGDNPAYKNLIQIAQANFNKGKESIDFRTVAKNKHGKMIFARDWEDFLQRELKCYTTFRSFLIMTLTYFHFCNSLRIHNNFFPVGRFGITSIKQTHFYKVYGGILSIPIIIYPIISFYIFAKTSIFFGKMFYDRVLLQERNYLYELQNREVYAGKYFYEDTPLSCENNLPPLARYLMGQGVFPDPIWKDNY